MARSWPNWCGAMPTKQVPSWPRLIAHPDMNAFYAAVEQLDNPSLAGQALWAPAATARAALTARYEARPYCLGRAMPMAKARRLCLYAVIFRPAPFSDHARLLG